MRNMSLIKLIRKPYADALELAESMAKDVEGEIIYCIDDEKIKKSKLKGMSTKKYKIGVCK